MNAHAVLQNRMTLARTPPGACAAWPLRRTRLPRNRRSPCCAKAAMRSRRWSPPPPRIAVVYPHMNSIGGDAFWLIHVPGETPRGIDACGAARLPASTSTLSRTRGLDSDTVSRRAGGQHRRRYGLRMVARARATARKCSAARLPLARLLADAIHYARHGIPVTAQPARRPPTAKLDGLLEHSPDSPRRSCRDGDAPRIGDAVLPAALGGNAAAARRRRASTISIAVTSRARSSRDLAACGSPLTAGRSAQPPRPAGARRCRLEHSSGTLYNLPPPTQGAGIAADSRHPRSHWTSGERNPTAPTTCTCASRR